jgi:hypothetical protein
MSLIPSLLFLITLLLGVELPIFGLN